MPQLDYYEILQVSPDADDEVIRATYRALTKKFHPDTGRPTVSKEMMITINEAFSVLSDPKLRSDYDHARLQKSASQSDASGVGSADRELIFSSDFSMSSAPLAETVYPQGSISARNGSFFMQVLPGGYLYSGMIGPVSDCEIQVELQTTIRVQNSDEEPDEDAVSAGVVFRQSGDRGYLFRIWRNGYFRLDALDSIAFTPKHEGYSEALRRLNGSNLLSVRATGPWITLSANGSTMAVIEDFRSVAGGVALFVECDDGGTAGTATFRDLRVYAVREDSPRTGLDTQRKRDAMLRMQAVVEAKAAEDEVIRAQRAKVESERQRREFDALLRQVLEEKPAARAKAQHQGCSFILMAGCALFSLIGGLLASLV